MDPKLIQLCCQEFPTYESARKASGYNSDVIRYAEPMKIDFVAVKESLLTSPAIKVRTIAIQQLPSGFWGWIPDHPDDLAQVAEYKLQSSLSFCQTQIIQQTSFVDAWVLESSNGKEIQEGIKSDLRRNLFEEFWTQYGQNDRIYRISFLEQSGFSKEEEIPYPVYKIGVAILFAKEINSSH